VEEEKINQDHVLEEVKTHNTFTSLDLLFFFASTLEGKHKLLPA